MRGYSEDKDSNYDWYKIDSTILGVREKKSGGFAIKLHQFGDIISFKKLLIKILDHHKYQFMIFDTRSLSLKDNIRVVVEKELRNMKFGTYQSYNMVFQERPRKGDMVMIAIKPYVGRYEKGKVERVLTGAMYHPRGYKVMLEDKNNTVGRIATIIKKGHRG
jgi:uncharacterized protein YwbE